MKSANNKKSEFKRWALLFLPAVCISVVALEWFGRQSFLEILKWIIDQPEAFALNIFLVAAFFAALVGLTGRMRLGLFIGVLTLLLFGAVNMLKLQILHSPLLAWDLLYIKQLGALGVAINSKQMIFWGLSAGIILACLFVYLFKRRKKPLRIRSRIFFTGTAVIAMGLFWNASADPIRYLGVENIVWNQPQNYLQNGSILSFSMNISPLLLSRPEGYGRAQVSRLLENNQKPEIKDVSVDTPHPSVIFFMSESFSDLAGTLYETPGNYLENFKKLASQYPHFRMISPTFAGNTSLVEFESLTGLSNAFLPSGAIPFDHYLHRPTPSLAWILKENGYHTIAIHPFHPWFWNRNVVYPNLGFDQFISIDQFDPEAKKGFYTSDEALVDKIIEVIDASEGKFFIHVVSMENHGPYMPGRYEVNDAHFEHPLSEGLGYETECFLTGLQDADKQLGRLIKYLKRRKEPVICLFFGDHQPSFSIALYGELGKLKAGIDKEYQSSVVPGLIYSYPKGMIDAKDIPENLSPAYFPAIMLHAMGIPVPGYMRYLQQGISRYPVVHRDFVMDTTGSLRPFSEERSDPYLRGLEILNFDVLFGSRFSWPL